MADELKTVLGFDATQAINTLVKLDTQLTSYATTMDAAANSTTGFNTAAKSIDTTLGKLVSTQKVATTSQDKLAATITKLKSRVTTLEKEIEKLKSKTKKATKTMMLSWQSMARIFAIQTIHQAISKITGALADAVREAMDLEIALAEIQTIAPTLRANFEGVADAVHRLSNEFGIQRGIVAEGVYQTLSNQVAQGAESFEFFRDAADLSIGAVMSADAAVNLLSSTINSFGFASSQAATISGKLFKTIELGRLRGEEFANTIGRVYVLASQLGVSLDEANASLATFTISGLRYNEAATLTTNIMLKLIRPTDTLKKLMNEMGIASAEAGIQAFGFQGFLQLLRDAAGDTAESLGLVFGRVRAIRGVMGLTNEATEKYQKTLEALKKAGFEDILEAKELIFKTNAKQVEIELNALKNAIVFDFGREALNVINKVFKAFGGAVNIVKGLTAAVGILAVGAAILGAIFFPWVAMFAAWAAAIGLVTAAYNKLYTTASTKLKGLIKEQEKARDIAKKEISDLVELEILGMDKTYARLQKWIIQRKKGMKDIIEDAKFKEEFLTKILHQQLDDRASAWDTFVDAIEDKIADSADTIADSQKKIFDIQREIAGFDFEGSIKGKDPRKQSFAALDRSSDLLRDAGHAFREGRTGMAADLLSDAKSMAKLAMSSADAAKNASLEHRAREQVRAVLNKQLDQQEQIDAKTREQTQLATSVFGETKSRAERINKIIEDMKIINIYGPKGKKLLDENQAKIEFQRLAKALQFELDQAKAGKNLFDRIGLQKVFTEVTKDFENLLTKDPVSLKFTIDQYIDELYGDLRNYAKKNPIPWPIVKAFEELGIDVTTQAGLEAAPQILVEQSKNVNQLSRDTIDLTSAQKGFTDAIGNSAKISSAFFQDSSRGQKNLKEQIARTENQKFYTDKGSKERADQEAFITKLSKQGAILKDTTDNVRDAFANLTRGMENVDAERITNANTQLKIYRDHLLAIGAVNLAEKLRLYMEEVQKAAAFLPGIDLFEATKTDVDAQTERLRKVNEVLGPELNDSAAIGAQGVNNASTAMIESANRTEEAWRRAAIAMASVGSTPIQAHFGKMIYRASGGDARGTDTIPAMLSPGEFVMNAQSTKRFYSQIVAMNAGKTPVYRERGGPVTNVGDVNITVSGAASPKQTARETMRAFRREMRRHTSTI